MDAIKTDLDVYNDQVYAFTPTGDVINLPQGSTPIDFAYFIHSAVGNKMVGAKVNGKIVTFDYKVRNGDRIEVLTSQNSKGPSRDWLKIAKSTQAKTKINQWFRKQFKEDNITKGRDMLEKYSKSKNVPYSELLTDAYQQTVFRKYGFKDWDSVCAAVGHGGLKEGQIVNRLVEEYNKTHKIEVSAEDIIREVNENATKVTSKKSKSGIIVKGIDDLAVRFSRCCTPVPGDEIVGFITRGRGVSIHRTDCVNMINLSDEERARLIDAEWQFIEKVANNMLYKAELQLEGDDRQGMLVDVSRILTDEGIPIRALNARTTNTHRSIFNFTIEIKNAEQLSFIITKLLTIKGVYEVVRTTS